LAITLAFLAEEIDWLYDPTPGYPSALKAIAVQAIDLMVRAHLMAGYTDILRDGMPSFYLLPEQELTTTVQTLHSICTSNHWIVKSILRFCDSCRHTGKKLAMPSYGFLSGNFEDTKKRQHKWVIKDAKYLHLFMKRNVSQIHYYNILA
jgi:hypothetical protein